MRKQAIRFAIIDDDPEDVRILQHHLSKIPELHFTLEHIGSSGGYQESKNWPDIDIFFVDYVLQDCVGSRVLQEMRDEGDLRPVIVLTGQEDVRIATDLLELGVDDYLDKLDATPQVLQESIARALSRVAKTEADLAPRRLVSPKAGRYNNSGRSQELTQ